MRHWLFNGQTDGPTERHRAITHTTLCMEGLRIALWKLFQCLIFIHWHVLMHIQLDLLISVNGNQNCLLYCVVKWSHVTCYPTIAVIARLRRLFNVPLSNLTSHSVGLLYIACYRDSVAELRIFREQWGSNDLHLQQDEYESDIIVFTLRIWHCNWYGDVCFRRAAASY